MNRRLFVRAVALAGMIPIIGKVALGRAAALPMPQKAMYGPDSQFPENLEEAVATSRYPIFTLRDPNTGHEFQVYLNGSVDGFPDGYTRLNLILPFVRMAQARAQHQGSVDRDKLTTS